MVNGGGIATTAAYAEAVPARPRQTTVALRALLTVGSVLAFIAWVQLFVFAADTAQWFAWPVNPPITAAFLGAGYAGGVVLAVLAAREHVWAQARVAATGVEVFSTLALVATLLHLDRFRLDTVFGWAWLLVYVLIPPLLGALLLHNARVPGADPPRLAPMPLASRLVLGVQAVILLLVALVLFVAPAAGAALWPWPLTPLTGRAVGFWLAAMGAVAVLSVWENDWRRMRIPSLTLAVFCLFQLVVLLRYPEALDWSGPRAWLYLLVLLSLQAISLQGVLAARRAGAAGGA